MTKKEIWCTCCAITVIWCVFGRVMWWIGKDHATRVLSQKQDDEFLQTKYIHMHTVQEKTGDNGFGVSTWRTKMKAVEIELPDGRHALLGMKEGAGGETIWPNVETLQRDWMKPRTPPKFDMKIGFGKLPDEED